MDAQTAALDRVHWDADPDMSVTSEEISDDSLVSGDAAGTKPLQARAVLALHSLLPFREPFVS